MDSNTDNKDNKWRDIEEDIDDLDLDHDGEDFVIPEEQIRQAQEINREFREIQRQKLRKKIATRRNSRINGTRDVDFDASSLSKINNCDNFDDFAAQFINASNLGEKEKNSLRSAIKKINKI